MWPERAADVARMRAWGVPDELIEFSSWVEGWALEGEQLGDYPTIELPLGWGRGAAPSLAAVRDGLSRGMGMGSGGFGTLVDFSWFEGGLDAIPALYCGGSAEHYRNVSLISEMTSLRKLRTPCVDDELDLSRLTRLRSLTVQGAGALAG